MRKIISIVLLLFCHFHLHAQQLRVDGKVVDDSTGAFIASATVQVMGGKYTLTKGDGSFVLVSSNNNPMLIISASGFKTDTIKIVQKSSGLLIRLTPFIKLMDEVKVSTGYQQLSPERTTGSFEVIDNKLFNRGVSDDLLTRLEGVTSGLYVDRSRSTPGFFVRGLSTIRANTQPLIILDNFPYDGNINDIDPDNIENVTVLRDAGAASIWGAKAANGVIVINTKKGKYNQPKRVNLSVNYTVEKKPDLFKSNNFISSADFMEVEQFLFKQGYFDAVLDDHFSYPIVSPLVELLAKQRAGNASQAQVDSAISVWAKNDIRDDYSKYLYQDAIMQQYSTSLSGGTKNMNYLLGLNFDKTRTNLVRNEGHRGNINLRLNIKPVSRLEFQTGVVYTIATDYNNGFEAIKVSQFKGTTVYPYARLVDGQGKPQYIPREYRSTYTDTAGAGLLLDWRYNPLEELAMADNSSTRSDIQFSAGLKYDFTKSFSAELRTQWQHSNSLSEYNYSAKTFYARDMVNRYSNRGPNNTVIRNIPLGGILEEWGGSTLSGAGRAQLNYNGALFNQLEVAALAGFEIRKARAAAKTDGTYGWDENRLTFSNVDHTKLYNLWENLGSDVIYSLKGFNKTNNHFVSYFGNTAFTYKHKYLLSASIRKDASNLFGVNTNQKWNPFWSIGAGWKLSEEKFYDWKLFSKLAIRTTYGYSGNIMPSVSALPIISYSNNSVIIPPYANLSSAGNPNLRWEQTATWNMAVDFSLKKDRIGGSVEYYNKHSTDLLTSVPLDQTTGLSNQTLNAANLVSRGVNVKLSGLPLNRKIKWQVDLLLDHVTNKVTRFFNESDNKGQYVGYGTGITPLEGKDPYAMISYRWGGLDPLTGDPMGYINDTLSKNYDLLTRPTSFDDLVVKGSARPKWYGSIRNSFSYRNLSLSFNIRYAFAYYFRRQGLQYSSLYEWGMNKEFTERWQKPGDELHTNVPSMNYPALFRRDQFYFYSEANVEKGDHIRLQDIQLQYRLSGLKTKNALVKNAELSLYLNNIGIIWRANDKGIDPAFGYFRPIPVSLSAGLKTNF